MAADPDTFYRQRVPAQWNRTLELQAALAEDDPSARPMLDDMLRVEATIEVLVETGGEPHRYPLNVSAGRMTCGDEASKPPCIVLVHDLETFATLERESGDSVLGFLGTLAGQPGDMKLTSTRLQNLLALHGRARLELTGGAPMDLEARFGEPAPGEPTPSCTLRIDAQAFAALREGQLAPQDAFLSGRVDVEGDMQLAMQLALAALSPD